MTPFEQVEERVVDEAAGKVRFPGGATRSSDAEDVRFDLIPPLGLRRLAARYALGAQAHGERNWEAGMPAGDVVNHLYRHLNLWMAGDNRDDHLAAIAWGIFALMTFEITHPECLDDIPTRREMIPKG